MARKLSVQQIIKFFIAAVWVANGLLCKVLNLVPRHERIVARVLGEENAALFTKIIGVAEIVMALWILSGIKSRWNAVTQIVIIATMNVIEFTKAPDLLLWGRGNSIFALLFILLIWFNQFIISKKSIAQA